MDGLSDDGKTGITLIAFVGSVFSPYYAWAGRTDPLDHAALNVALYGDGWSRWAMTERRRSKLNLGPDGLDIGASAVRWTGDALEIQVVERSVPHLTALRGVVRVLPEAVSREAYPLDAGARHWWRPVAPSARIEVAFERPEFRWSGAGYFDMNWGVEPLEKGFQRWDWSRAGFPNRGAAVLYDATRTDGSELSLALRFDRTGAVEQVDPPPRMALPNTLWRVGRRTQADTGAEPRELRRCEDAPFYARAELATRLFGEDVHAMHETFDGTRFDTRWVKALLPWRMPRDVLGGWV
ncbi:MAG: carotenoid 1,2-hydratase [Rhodobacteraceae bacterium]|nr:carotenoid 1,2-hydratase [Paracoccaceae bacterium]